MISPEVLQRVKLNERIADLEAEIRKRAGTNERLRALTRKYGHPTIDFFGDSWRVWFSDGWHHHHRLGLKAIFGEKAAQKIGASYSGGIAGYGTTIEDAIDRLEASIADVPPSKGSNCRKGVCPYYEDDLY